MRQKERLGRRTDRQTGPLPAPMREGSDAARAAAVPPPPAGRVGSPSARLAPASLHANASPHVEAHHHAPGHADATLASTGLALQVEDGVDPQQLSLGAPRASAVRTTELSHLLLPRTEMRPWNADDLDVPAFLRRQMD